MDQVADDAKTPFRRQRTWRRRLQLFGLVVLLIYVVCEAAITTFDRIRGEPFFALVEWGDEPPMRFDPITGYRNSSSPYRLAQISDGVTL